MWLRLNKDNLWWLWPVPSKCPHMPSLKSLWLGCNSSRSFEIREFKWERNATSIKKKIVATWISNNYWSNHLNWSKDSNQKIIFCNQFIIMQKSVQEETCEEWFGTSNRTKLAKLSVYCKAYFQSTMGSVAGKKIQFQLDKNIFDNKEYIRSLHLLGSAACGISLYFPSSSLSVCCGLSQSSSWVITFELWQWSL